MLRDTLYVSHIHTYALLQKTASKAVIEMCEGDQGLGDGFQLLIGLAEIHVPRMWVEEDDQSHHVRHCVLISVESCDAVVGLYVDILS